LPTDDLVRNIQRIIQREGKEQRSEAVFTHRKHEHGGRKYTKAEKSHK
jgi:metal-responsive CopG/Arc/MetJ family transcriptional regulator